MTPVLILQTVRQWPLGTRLTLVQDILKTVQQEQEGTSFKRKKTLHQALGLAATDQPAPTDAEVSGWLDERRNERHG